MKPIRFNNFITFAKARNDGYQRCVYCSEKIGKGKVGLSLVKQCVNKYNVWVHINCIDDFCKDVKRFKEDNIKNILIENIK